MQATPPCEMPSSVTGSVGRAASMIDSRSSVHCVDGQLAVVPLAHPAAPLVVAHEPEMRREELHPVPPDGAFPFVLEMREPVGRLDEDRTRARFRPRQPRAVRRRRRNGCAGEASRGCSSAGPGHLSHTAKPRCQPDRDKAPIPRAPPRRHSLRHQEGMHVQTVHCSSPMAWRRIWPPGHLPRVAEQLAGRRAGGRATFAREQRQRARRGREGVDRTLQGRGGSPRPPATACSSVASPGPTRERWACTT